MSEMNKGYLLSHLLEEGIMKDKSSWYVKVPVKQQSHNRNRLLWARSCTILLNCLGTEVNGNFLLMVEMESFYSLTSIPFLLFRTISAVAVGRDPPETRLVLQ